jgi:hypothetical protein
MGSNTRTVRVHTDASNYGLGLAFKARQRGGAGAMKPAILNMGKIHQADAAHSDVSIFLREVEGRGEDRQQLTKCI